MVDILECLMVKWNFTTVPLEKERGLCLHRPHECPTTGVRINNQEFLLRSLQSAGCATLRAAPPPTGPTHGRSRGSQDVPRSHLRASGHPWTQQDQEGAALERHPRLCPPPRPRDRGCCCCPRGSLERGHGAAQSPRARRHRLAARHYRHYRPPPSATVTQRKMNPPSPRSALWQPAGPATPSGTASPGSPAPRKNGKSLLKAGDRCGPQIAPRNPTGALPSAEKRAVAWGPRDGLQRKKTVVSSQLLSLHTDSQTEHSTSLQPETTGRPAQDTLPESLPPTYIYPIQRMGGENGSNKTKSLVHNSHPTLT